MSPFDDLIQNGRDTAAAAKARIGAGLDEAKAATGELATKGREQVQKLGEKVAPAVQRGKDEAAKANNKLKEAAESGPLTLLAGAAAFGALLGTLLPKRSKPEE